MSIKIADTTIVNDSRESTNLVFKSYTENVTNLGTITDTTFNLDLSQSSVYQITLGANVDFTFTNPPASGQMRSVTLILTQDGTGSRTANITNEKYTEGQRPILSVLPNETDIMTFFTFDGGSSYYGSFAMANVSSVVS